MTANTQYSRCKHKK